MKCRLTIPCLMVFVFALSGQAPAPVFNRGLLVGSWKVNCEKSKMANAGTSPLPNLYRFYEDHGDGFMLHTAMVVDASQRHAQLMLLAAVKYDDKEYPTFTGERLTSFLATGKKPVETVSFKVVDANTMEWTDRTNGKVTGTGTVALSSDGKTMTDANKNFDGNGKQTSSSVLTYQRE